MPHAVTSGNSLWNENIASIKKKTKERKVLTQIYEPLTDVYYIIILLINVYCIEKWNNGLKIIFHKTTYESQ